MQKVYYVIAFLGILAACTATRIGMHCRNCENVTLYYLPDCKEIKGYVNFENSGLQKVFQHELPEAFRKDSISVCIKYEKEGVGIVMSDCLQSEIIRITCIREK